jgi:hypothetical protein
MAKGCVRSYEKLLEEAEDGNAAVSGERAGLRCGQA